MRSALQNNSLENLHRTLLDIASDERQVAYKSAVPFVHVPAELLEQWFDYARLLDEAQWFREMFTAQAMVAMRGFTVHVARTKQAMGGSLPDVPEILATPSWRALAVEAERLLGVVPLPDTAG